MLAVRLLGHFDVRIDDQPVEIASRPAKTLLAYLLLTAGTRHPREKLAGILWPESDESNARSNLRQALWRLRKAIGDEYVRADHISVSLNTESEVWLDVSLLEPDASDDLIAAAAVYKGELLPGYYEDWVQLERERLEAAFELTMQRLLDDLSGQGLWPETRKWAEHWIAFGTTPEPAYRALMTAHAAQGDLAGMSSAYERCVTALRLELGVEPSVETQALYERLSQGAIPAPSRLDVAGRAEQPTGPRHNLPHQSTPFIGRERELAEIGEALSNDRLVTLVGPGGIGKTRLALEAAAGLVDEFKNGVFLIRLAPISAADKIVQTIAEAIGFPLATYEDPKRQLLRHLKRRQYLLLFDNFEHLLTGAALVAEILQVAGNVKVLATSREKLNLREESILRLGGLSYPQSPVEEPLKYSAIRLFLDSAGRQISGFTIEPKGLPHIIQICRLVDGMPLGILLATAWMDLLTVEEIAAEIDRSFDFLQVEWRNVPSRHRSLRAVFESSWQRLTERQRLLFSRLTVFRGGFTREAAVAVAGVSLQGLADLVNKSLLQWDMTTGRYEIHELLRQYAREYLETIPGESEAVSIAHATHYADLMDRYRGHMTDRRVQRAFAAVDADLENIRHAWRFWLYRKDASRIKMFSETFWRVYDIRGWYSAGERLFHDAAEALRPASGETEDEERIEVYAQQLTWLAYFKAHMGKSQEGFNLSQKSVAILKQFDWTFELAMAVESLHYNAVYVTNPVDAVLLEREVTEQAIVQGDRWTKAYFLCWQGRYNAWHGDYQQGRAQAKESLRIFEELGDIYASVWPGLELGHLAVQAGEFEEAQTYYRRVLESASKVDFIWAVAKTTRNLANVATIMGDLESARSYVMWALRLADELGLIRDIVSLLYDLATIEVATGSYAKAVPLLSIIRDHPLSRQTRTFSVFLGDEKVRYVDLADDLLARLRTELSAHIYDHAVAHSREMKLDELVTQLLTAD